MECYTEKKANKIKADYEKRLREMNRDLQKLQAAQKNTRGCSRTSLATRGAQKLQAEVAEMKKAKVGRWRQGREVGDGDGGGASAGPGWDQDGDKPSWELRARWSWGGAKTEDPGGAGPRRRGPSGRG